MKPVIMFSEKCILLVIIYLVKGFSSATINPPTKSATSCNGDISRCLQESMQRALPTFAEGNREIEVERLDPLTVQRLDLNFPGGLNIQFRQGYAKGLRNCVVDKARLVENVLDTEIVCNVSINGKYKSTGRLLMFPINGDGDASIKCRNVRISIAVTLKSVEKEHGSKYLEIVDIKTKHKFVGRITYKLTNIFKGSPETSKLVMEFINHNWRLVAEEFGDPIVEFGVTRIMSNVKQALKMIPVEKMLSFPLEF
ncbi:hypothetical protein evm_001064 [Chilo suppressalis]|nr:hypothetical protein evm_001064 [Chilo suppressalis]